MQAMKDIIHVVESPCQKKIGKHGKLFCRQMYEVWCGWVGISLVQVHVQKVFERL